jgi:hypothetical protein
MTEPNKHLTPEDLKRLANTLDMLAPKLYTHGRLADLPLTADDWAMVYAAYQGFTLTVQHIAKRVIERELAKQSRQDVTVAH